MTAQQLAGTLFVEDEEANPLVSPAVAGSVGPLTRLATRVSPSHAHRLAVDYLVQKYGLHHSIAEDEVREQFPAGGNITVTLPEPEFDAGQERTVRFRFINTAPAQKGQPD